MVDLINTGTGRSIRPPSGSRAYVVGDARHIFDMVAGAVLIFFLFYSYYFTLSQSNSVALLSFVLLVNGVLSVTGLLIAMRAGFSLFMITFLFNFIFFSIAPLQQISIMWRPVLLDAAALPAALLCLTLSITGLFALAMRSNIRLTQTRGRWGYSLLEMPPHLLRKRLTLLFLVVAPLAMALVALYSPVLFSTRFTFGVYFGRLFPRELSLMVISLVHPFIFIGGTVGFALACRTRNYPYILLFGFVMLLAMLLYNPSITPRFRLSAMIMFFVLTFIGWRSTRVIFLTLVAGMTVSPLLNSLRWKYAGSDVRELGTFFAHMDYDAFTMFIFAIKYVALMGVDRGGAILAAIFFFVPRGLWTNKSEHLGAIMFEFLVSNMRIAIDNLSSPPVMEGYFAFGTLGAIAAGVVYFYMIYRLERGAEGAADFAPAQLLACLVSMFLFILQRGPLIVGISETFGSALALIGVLWVVGAFRKSRTQPIWRDRPAGMG